MNKSFMIFTERGKQKRVSGEIVDPFFGIHHELGKGWRITHIFSGCCLTSAYFVTLEDAKEFSQLAIRIYGEHLYRSTPDTLTFAESKVKNGRQFKDLIYYLNELEDAISMVEVRDAGKQVGCIYDDTKQRVGERGVIPVSERQPV